MSDETTETERPSGRLRPESGEVGEIHDRLAEREYDEALEQIEEAEPEGALERDWLGYLRGLGLLGARELDDAYESFRSTAERVTSASADELERDRMRVAAKCLKKMGWYHRRGEGHARAYAYHSMEYELIEEYGSPLELHDAALSLDVVAYHLRTPRISKGWIERSIDAAAEIEGESSRRKALGISWNNLTGTLCDLEDFEEAGDAAEESLEHWRAYEELEGPAENRVVWAKHIYADAYKRWGDHLVESGDRDAGIERLERAREVIEEALDEAESREMSDEDVADIQGKLDGVLESLEEAGVEVDDSADEEGEESEPADEESEATDEEPEADEESEAADEESDVEVDENSDGDESSDDESDDASETDETEGDADDDDDGSDQDDEET